MTVRAGAEGLGVVLGVLALLWGVNAAALWLFEYPAVFCLADTLATETLRQWYQMLGFCLLLYLLGALFAQGVGSLPANLAVFLLYALAPEWFGIAFRGEVGCG